MGNLFQSGEQTTIDPFMNAISLATHAEKIARRNKNVEDILTVSTQWLAIAQIHKELSKEEPEAKNPTGFTGGNNG